MTFAWAAKSERERRRPPNARVNDAVRCAGTWLMGDGASVGAIGGDSAVAWRGRHGPRHGERLGRPRREGGRAGGGEEVQQLARGLHMNFAAKTTRLPDARC
eukprot:5817839-Pyramimonas_sp.AAC.1